MWSNPYKSTTQYIQLKQDIFSLSQGSKSSKRFITLCTSDGTNIYPQEFIKNAIKLLNYNWHKWVIGTSKEGEYLCMTAFPRYLELNIIIIIKNNNY